MYKRIQKLFFLLIMPTLAIAQVPNASFENWTNGLPDSWTGNIAPPDLIPITQSTDAHSGTYAVQGTVVDYMGSAVPPNFYPLSSSGLGFNISQRYNYFLFWYKANFIGTDVGTVNVVIYHSSGISIGYGYSYFTSSANYVLMYVPLSYTSSGNAAHAQVTISMADTASNGFHLGSDFIIDDFGFSMVNNVSEINENTFNVYPNPVCGKLNIKGIFKSNESYDIAIINSEGKTVLKSTEKTSSNELPPIDVADLSDGYYLLNISDSHSTTTQRILINR
jgi:hypothetical protein